MERDPFLLDERGVAGRIADRGSRDQPAPSDRDFSTEITHAARGYPRHGEEMFWLMGNSTGRSRCDLSYNTGADFVEFDSMINVRPSQGNRSRGVEDEALRTRIRAIVDGLVER
jgi:hypothetical protein